MGIGDVIPKPRATSIWLHDVLYVITHLILEFQLQSVMGGLIYLGCILAMLSSRQV